MSLSRSNKCEMAFDEDGICDINHHCPRRRNGKEFIHSESINVAGEELVQFAWTKPLPTETRLLNLSNNSLTSIPRFTAESLTTLVMDNNPIISGASVFVPPSVVTLSMTGTRIHSTSGLVLSKATVNLDISNSASLDTLCSMNQTHVIHLKANDGRLHLLFDDNFPPTIQVMELANQLLRSFANLTLPDSLQSITLRNNLIKEVRGNYFPDRQLAIDLSDNPIELFEVSQTTFDRFSKYNYQITLPPQYTSNHTKCQTPGAEAKTYVNNMFCVVPDDKWKDFYPTLVTMPITSPPTSVSTNQPASKAPTNSMSTINIGIVSGAVIGVLVVVGLVMLFRKRSKPNRDKDGTTFNSMLSAKTHDSAVTVPSGIGDPNNFWNDPILSASRIPLSAIQEEKRIGHGAFGEVYLGQFSGRKVAIKRLKAVYRRDPKHLMGFLNEVKLMASMDHPNIVQFIGISCDTLTNMSVIFEFMDRSDLATVLKNQRESGMSTGFNCQRLLIAFNIANGLTYLHSLEPKILHRDLKSQNVLLNDQMVAKLTDFGISRESSECTMTAGIGTSRWMAPQVMMGGHYDEKADIFSLGVVLSELDTLESPYANHTVDGSGRRLPEAALLQKVAMGELTVSFTEQCLPEAVALARSCVSLAPEDRPTAAEVSYRLQVMLKSIDQAVEVYHLD